MIEVERTIRPDAYCPDLCASLLRQQLPRYDVGVVFQFGQQDFIAGLDLRPAPALRHQIDGFGCTARKNDFIRTGSIQKACDRGSGVFKRIGGGHRQPVGGAVHGPDPPGFIWEPSDM